MADQFLLTGLLVEGGRPVSIDWFTGRTVADQFLLTGLLAEGGRPVSVDWFTGRRWQTSFY